MLFYIGEKNCSGIRTNDEEDFFEYLKDRIETAMEEGDNLFEITVNASFDPSIEE